VSQARTKLAKRAVRVVSRLRVRVEEGPDAGALAAPEDGGALTVGTSPDSTLALTDPTVSRYHLELRHGREGVVAEDLGSRNGTFVGGVRIERALLPPGTRLRIGATTLAVEDAGEVAAPPEDAPQPLPDLVGESEAMAEVVRLVRKLARVGSSVLIEGETGAGKEVVARAIHDAGPRRDRPFVVVDCGSMPATLIASQLFGHERGAFTGATEERVGAFERAGGGTVLLDEIGELPVDVQPALLGVLERRRFVRVGGAREVDVDVRVLAATNRDLRAEVNAGSFRADLYYRLAVTRLLIPPLRERPEDIEPLVRHFAERLTGIPDENPLAGSMDALVRHRWSGNVRELRNVVESSIVMGELRIEQSGGGGGGGIEHEHGGDEHEYDRGVPYREARARALWRFEEEYLGRLIERCGGNASEAARQAQMDRPYLLTLLRRHNLR
jgi:DNA-binding NtrC family response regulator